MVNDAFDFFGKLSDERVAHNPCNYEIWKMLNYRCVPYKKKFIIAYLSLEKEIVICDFVPAKLLKQITTA